ncbi:hypothetical protein [Pseudorhodoferax sp.]|uniref:hypothetical protein n=1 Tax=Pseudorhodoferax sp. TaxID=1993553 RepID=UPI0039E4D6C9
MTEQQAIRPAGVSAVPWTRPDGSVACFDRRSFFRRIDWWAARLPLAGVTFVSKIGAPKLASLGISLAIPFIYLGWLVGLAAGRLVVDPGRCMLFMATMALLWSLQIIQGDHFSLLSLLMLSVLHFPYVFAGRTSAGGMARGWSAYREISTLIAVCGLVQYFVQFAVGPQLAFPMDNLVPEPLRVLGFNGQGWIEYGSSIIRSNGVFMLEASFFSQLLAIALIGELVMGKPSLVRMAIYVCGILVSYSGTGLLSLMACLPVWIVRRRRWDVALCILCAALLMAAVYASGWAGDSEILKVFLDRSNEFTSTGSSGFARFVGGYYMFEQFLWPDMWRTLFGFGAGSFLGYSEVANYAAHGMALFKMIFEFGLVGAVAYFAFLVYCFSTSDAPLELKVAIFVPLLIQNYVPFAHGVAFVVLIWSTSSRKSVVWR